MISDYNFQKLFGRRNTLIYILIPITKKQNKEGKKIFLVSFTLFFHYFNYIQIGLCCWSTQLSIYFEILIYRVSFISINWITTISWCGHTDFVKREKVLNCFNVWRHCRIFNKKLENGVRKNTIIANLSLTDQEFVYNVGVDIELFLKKRLSSG